MSVGEVVVVVMCGVLFFRERLHTLRCIYAIMVA